LNTNIFGSDLNFSKLINSIKKTKNKEIFLEKISKLQKMAEESKKKSKSDQKFYFNYDLIKSLNIILRMKKFSVDECYRSKVEHFSLYGIRSDNFNKSDLPIGASLSYELLSSICKK
jgi:hypothetical protein